MPDSAQYPQFFVVDEKEQTSYVGDLGRLQDIDEDSQLPDSIIGAHPLIMTWTRLLGAGYRNKLLLIISTIRVDRKQTYRQERAKQLLRAKKIPFEALDAADQSLKERYVIGFNRLVVLSNLVDSNQFSPNPDGTNSSTLVESVDTIPSFS